MSTWRHTSAAIAIVAAAAATASANDPLDMARQLYASAAYEDALVMLNRLRADTGRSDHRTIEQYRAFCLLALGRDTDAEQAIEAVVAAAPSYQPSESDVSPRVRAAFSEVRRRMLPGIIQEKYKAAKATFDRQQFAEAAAAFRQVLDAMADPDLAAAAGQPPLADLRTLAAGFHELSAKAAAPPPPPQPPPAAEPAPPPQPVAPLVYVQGDRRVVPPRVIRQTLPAFPAHSAALGDGMIEVVIDELGRVESVTMRDPFHPKYDTMAVDAARHWQYTPATVDGRPVKYRKFVQVSLKR